MLLGHGFETLSLGWWSLVWCCWFGFFEMALSGCAMPPLLVQVGCLEHWNTVQHLHVLVPMRRDVICPRSKTASLWTVCGAAQPGLLWPLCCLSSCLQNPFSFWRHFRWKCELLVGQISLTSALSFLLTEGCKIILFVMYLIGAK